MRARSALIVLLLFFNMAGISQLKAVYSFPSEDSTLKNQLYAAALSKKVRLVTSLSGEHKDDYKAVYESRFELISSLMKSSRLVAEPDAHAYLQKILDRIVSVNEELKPLEVRLVFSRDSWVNAYSVGEGTLIVNAGLLIRLKNEAELAFVLCHELAHYYLDHSAKSIQKMISTAKTQPDGKPVIKRHRRYRLFIQVKNGFSRKCAYREIGHGFTEPYPFSGILTEYELLRQIIRFDKKFRPDRDHGKSHISPCPVNCFFNNVVPAIGEFGKIFPVGSRKHFNRWGNQLITPAKHPDLAKVTGFIKENSVFFCSKFFKFRIGLLFVGQPLHQGGIVQEIGKVLLLMLNKFFR